MIPRDIETTEQWQVRWTAIDNTEIVRTGTETQVRWLADQKAEFGAIVEKRTITVGQWRNPDAPEPKFEEGPTASNALETEGDDAADG